MQSYEIKTNMSNLFLIYTVTLTIINQYMSAVLTKDN